MLIISILTLFSIVSVSGETIPPPPGAPPKLEEANDVETEDEVTITRGLAAAFYELQAKGSAYIKSQMDFLREGFHLKTFLIIIFFSLGYGIFHTLGPGHGKLIVMSFFIQENTTKADAILLSVIVSVIHSSGAIALAILFQTLLRSVKGIEQIRLQYGFTLFSGLMILTIGSIYLTRLIRKKDRPRKQIPMTSVETEDIRSRWKRNLLIGFSIGVVPCPLSLTIMMLSIIYGIFWIGITSVISLTLSMVIVLYIISILTIRSRDYLEDQDAVRKSSGYHRALTVMLNYMGSIFLIALGFYFSYSAGKALFI